MRSALQLHLDVFGRRIAQVFGGVLLRLVPRGLPGLCLNFLRRTIRQGKPDVCVSQVNLYLRGMLMHGVLLVRAHMPVQYAHLRILELNLTVLRVYLRRVLC